MIVILQKSLLKYLKLLLVFKLYILAILMIYINIFRLNIFPFSLVAHIISTISLISPLTALFFQIYYQKTYIYKTSDHYEQHNYAWKVSQVFNLLLLVIQDVVDRDKNQNAKITALIEDRPSIISTNERLSVE